jgi:LmbE family N-acetylglucosaminyl deacetylase
VVIFDSALAGTARAVWDADPRLRALPALSLDQFDRVVVVAAHPDDETLGAGGLISTCSRRGIPVDICVVTDGSASHPHSPTHSPTELASLRRKETRSALETLSPGGSVQFFGIRDGAVRERQRQLRRLLASAIAPVSSRTMIVAPWRGDGHRDHRVVGEACAALVDNMGGRLLEYPIWMWHWANPGDDAVPWTQLVSLPLDEVASEAKRRAIAEHRSQIRPLTDEVGDETVLSERFISNFDRAFEVFIEQSTAVPWRYFDEKYERSSDPWGFETRWYERRKRDMIIASLPTEHYGSALEIGCSIGVFTEQLAARCDRILAVDIADAAVVSAREKLKELPHVTVAKRNVGNDFPRGSFDLVMLSEVGYYFDRSGLEVLLDEIEAALGETGTLVACHWRHPVDEHPLTGDAVHEAIARRPGLRRIASHLEEDFLLEVFSRDARSVASRTGLA